MSPRLPQLSRLVYRLLIACGLRGTVYDRDLQIGTKPIRDLTFLCDFFTGLTMNRIDNIGSSPWTPVSSIQMENCVGNICETEMLKSGMHER